MEFVEEQGDIYESLIFVEFVLEKKQTLENYQVLENQAGRIVLNKNLVINISCYDNRSNWRFINKNQKCISC